MEGETEMLAHDRKFVDMYKGITKVHLHSLSQLLDYLTSFPLLFAFVTETNVKGFVATFG